MKTLGIFVISLVGASLALAGDYEIDAAHSSVGFAVRHLVVSKTKGTFDKFSGHFSYTEDKPETWKVEASIDPASINTNNKKRDEHLRSADFFDVAKFKNMEFKSTKVTGYKRNMKTAELHGELTMHGVTKPVVLNMEIGGTVKDFEGNSRTGFTATGKIKRSDFGLTWNKALEAGGVAVGDEVELALEIEGSEKKMDSKKAKK